MYGGIKLYMSPPKHERPKRATNIVVCDYQITNVQLMLDCKKKKKKVRL